MKVIMRVPDEGYYEGTRWRLLWEYQMKVIMRVPDEGYYEGTRWRLLWEYQMKVIMRVPDEGYYESTRWRLLWEYQMKVIMRVPEEGHSRNSSCALISISTFLLRTFVKHLFQVEGKLGHIKLVYTRHFVHVPLRFVDWILELLARYHAITCWIIVLKCVPITNRNVAVLAITQLMNDFLWVP
jgi:hypothetical protein